jgi:hypothetical protein
MISGIRDPHLAQIRPVRVRTPQGCEECLSLGTPLEPGEDWRWCYPHEAFV